MSTIPSAIMNRVQLFLQETWRIKISDTILNKIYTHSPVHSGKYIFQQCICFYLDDLKKLNETDKWMKQDLIDTDLKGADLTNVV